MIILRNFQYWPKFLVSYKNISRNISRTEIAVKHFCVTTQLMLKNGDPLLGKRGNPEKGLKSALKNDKSYISCSLESHPLSELLIFVGRKHSSVIKAQILVKSSAKRIARDGKLGNLHPTPSSPHETPGTESLSKWVPTHPEQIEIMLGFLKNQITPQMGFEGHPFSDVMNRKTTMEGQRISSSAQRETKASHS